MNQGWVCPKCERCLAPSVKVCEACLPEKRPEPAKDQQTKKPKEKSLADFMEALAPCKDCGAIGAHYCTGKRKRNCACQFPWWSITPPPDDYCPYHNYTNPSTASATGWTFIKACSKCHAAHDHSKFKCIPCAGACGVTTYYT